MAFFSSLFGCDKPSQTVEPNPANGVTTFTHPTAGFTITTPAGWTESGASDYFQILSPGEKFSITVSAYGADGGPFEEFANYRFSSVEEFYKETTEPRRAEVPKMIIREYEGIWPGEDRPTSYIVGCGHVGDAYLSIGIVTDPASLRADRSVVDGILSSLKPTSEQDGGGQPATRPESK